MRFPFRSLAVASVLGLLLAGCSATADIPFIEAQALEIYNKELERKGTILRGTKLILSHESGNKYVGILEVSDGSRANADVTYDGNNIVIRVTD